jgi:large subunit ribosomal protein L24
MSKKIRRGDRVRVIAGNEKGKTGEVLVKGDDRVIVKEVNMRKKHLRATQQTPGGRIILMETPIHISNVVLCDKDGNVLKVRVRTNQEGERELVHGAPKKEVVYRSLKKV